jgi:dolichyl-phosphate beta-glucosyltransferase
MTMPVQGEVPGLSVILPAYNEADRILPYLSSITKYLDQRAGPFEILVVNDGSTDATAAGVRRFAESAPSVRVLDLPANRGKGAAVRAGMQAARGRLLLMADADGATPIEELERLEQAIAQGAQIAVGSRTLASRDPRYRVQARWHRSLLGDVFNWIVQRLGIRGIMDTQCGFKLFQADTARALFGTARIDHYGFDLEILYLAQRRGFRLREVPINWNDQAGSKVRVVRDGCRMLFDLLQIRRDYRHGRYD